MASATLTRTNRRPQLVPAKRPVSPRAVRSVTPSPDTIAELLQQLGDIPPERVRLKPTPGTATKRDLLRLLDKFNIQCELVDGTLVEKAMGQIESNLGALLIHYLYSFLDGNDLGRVYASDAPHELVSKLIRLPDVAFASYGRIPEGEARKKPVASWAPDLAVEILSKSNTRKEIDRKRREYFDAGVRLLWVADPRKKTVKVYTSCDDCVTLGTADMLDGGTVLPGFKLSIGEWYAKVD
ncbi:MAG: Uma2 family endonuclease [Candidatus Saccharimonas sp.]|nr:Uma2 family endonuclease [Planctomycetaceae bacterium]